MLHTAGVLDEKAAATQALGIYAKATLANFAPYIEEVLKVLLRMAAYFHDDVREQAYEALSFLVAATIQAFPASARGLLLFRITNQPCAVKCCKA